MNTMKIIVSAALAVQFLCAYAALVAYSLNSESTDKMRAITHLLMAITAIGLLTTVILVVIKL